MNWKFTLQLIYTPKPFFFCYMQRCIPISMRNPQILGKDSSPRTVSNPHGFLTCYEVCLNSRYMSRVKFPLGNLFPVTTNYTRIAKKERWLGADVSRSWLEMVSPHHEFKTRPSISPPVPSSLSIFNESLSSHSCPSISHLSHEGFRRWLEDDLCRKPPCPVQFYRHWRLSSPPLQTKQGGFSFGAGSCFPSFFVFLFHCHAFGVLKSSSRFGSFWGFRVSLIWESLGFRVDVSHSSFCKFKTHHGHLNTKIKIKIQTYALRER